MVSLTRRQAQVLTQLISDGADNLTIARRLCISEDTVKTHVKALLLATGYPHRTAMVVGYWRGEYQVGIRPNPHHSART